MGDGSSPRPFWRRYFPPYYKYAVFLLSGFELIFACFVLAIAEAYYKAAALLLPISYRIFDDTLKKGMKDFPWDAAAKHSLEMYKYKMMVLWVVCTISVLFCMFVIIPQFFDFNDARGNRSHLCLVRRRLGWILFVIQAFVTVLIGAAIVWAWIGCGDAVDLFRKLFNASHKEEVFLSELENRLDCSTDDDKEVDPADLCEQNVHMSFINKWWMDTILGVYFIGHAVVIILVPLFNKQLIKDDDDDLDVTSKELIDE